MCLKYFAVLDGIEAALGVVEIDLGSAILPEGIVRTELAKSDVGGGCIGGKVFEVLANSCGARKTGTVTAGLCPPTSLTVFRFVKKTDLLSIPGRMMGKASNGLATLKASACMQPIVVSKDL